MNKKKKIDLINEDVDTAVTPAAQTIASKTVAIDQITQAILGAEGDDWTRLAEVLAQVGTESEGVQDGTAEKNAASIAMKGAIKEDLQLIFGDSTELSEEFKTKVSTLFEAAVNTRVSLVLEEKTQELEEAFNSELESVTESLIENVDEYLSYVAEKWLEDNEVAIESSLKSDISEDFISDLRKLFLEHNIVIPEEKEDLVEDLIERNNKLEDILNETLQDNKELTELAEQSLKEALIYQASEGLPLTSVNKFRELSEQVEFEGDVEEFSKKLDILKETYLNNDSPKLTKKTSLVTEEIAYEDKEDKKLTGAFGYYSDAISRSVKN